MSLEETLLAGKSNFLGRDGFRWWIGQIAPRVGQSDQVDDGIGWGSRYKVRIQGYHPFNDDDIKYDDLPYAIALLPTTAGSGGANYANSTVLQQGDIVFGFFLDGDEAQVPAIIAHFSRTKDVEDDRDYSEPFVPYTGFTENTPHREKIHTPQANEQNRETQVTNMSSDSGVHVDQNGSKRKIIPSDTCTPSSVSRMALAVETLSERVEEFSLTGMKLEAEIEAVAEQIETMANGFVGRMMDATYNYMEPQLQKGLDKVYEETFGKVFEQLGNSPQSYAAAHEAGTAAQVGQVPAIKNAENALACVAAKVVEGLRGTVADMLKDILASGLGYAGCVGANFVSKFLNNIVDSIVDNMKGPLSGLSDLLENGLNIADFLRGSAFVLEDFSGFLDCGQTNKDKCPPMKKYEVAGGVMEKGADPFNYVIGQMQGASKGIGGLTDSIQGAVGAIQNPSGLLGGVVSGALGGGKIGGIAGNLISGGSLLGSISDAVVPSGIKNTLGAAGRISGLIDELSAGGGCLGGARNCGNPQVEIFGGGGLGAIGKVVLGKAIQNTKGLSSLTNSISKTASIIGVNLPIPGAGYKSPPAIRFTDKCGIGHGAHGHAVLAPDGTIAAVVIDSPGEGYPIIEEPDTNVGVTTVFVENPGKGYKPGDKIDETVFVIPAGLPPSEGQDPILPAIPSDDPDLVSDPYTKLVTPTQRQTVADIATKPIFELVVDPETGGVNAVRVQNVVKFETPPVLKILSETGDGAVLRPVFGDIPEAAQVGVITVVDCVGK